MYEELVKALRRCATRYVLAYEERKDVMQKATNAIEFLEDGLNGVSAANDRLSDWNEELEKELDSANEMNTALYGALPKWIPVTDRLPENEDRVLCCTENKKGLKNIVIGYYIAESRHWACGMNSNVTHWMPLPEPPKEKT